MARIEIPLAELDGYKQTINNLESVLASNNKQIESLTEENTQLKEAMHYILFGVSRAEVILQWNKIKNAVIKTLPMLKAKDNE